MRLAPLFVSGTLLAGAVAVIACRGNDTTPGPDTPAGGGNKIQDIQNDAMAPGTAVTLNGVIVTAIDSFGGKVGDFWVEEPEGGPFSGVHVYKADVNVVATLAIGDVVNISGAQKSEFALTGSGGDTTGRTVTELEPVTGGAMVVTKTGTGSAPAPSVVDALAIGQMYDATMTATGGGAAFSNAWEQWEGVLITVANVSAVGAPKSFGSTTPTPADNYSFGITGVAKVEGSLVDITSSGIARGTCLGNVTGVVDYFYDYLLLPRTAADMSTTGTGCPAAETVCADTVDNDGNGFADCKDNNCIITAGTCHTATTISSLDLIGDATPANPVYPTGGVLITGACVTAITSTNIYIAAAGTAANDGGLYVYGGGQPLPSGLVVGSTVDVVGTVDAFKQKSSTAPEPQLELSGLQITKNGPTCTPAAKSVVSPMGTLTMDTNGHPLIGSYVSLTPNVGNFKITTAQSSTGKFGVLTENGVTVSFGMSILGGNLGAVNTCFNTIVGIWTYDTTGAGSYEILPTAMPATATCL